MGSNGALHPLLVHTTKAIILDLDAVVPAYEALDAGLGTRLGIGEVRHSGGWKIGREGTALASW